MVRKLCGDAILSVGEVPKCGIYEYTKKSEVAKHVAAAKDSSQTTWLLGAQGVAGARRLPWLTFFYERGLGGPH